MRYRTVTVAALVIGVGLGTAGCGRYSLEGSEGAEGLQRGQRSVQGVRLEGRRRKVRIRPAAGPQSYGSVLLPGEQLRQRLQAGPRRRGAERRLHAEGGRELQEGCERRQESRDEEAGPPVPGRGIRAGETERPVPGRAGDPAARSDGPERAERLLRTLEALRGLRPLRRGRAGAAQGPRREAE